MSDNQVLNQQERDELLKFAKKLAGDHSIDSCCAYGSKIAGYARPDSDYDLLLILKNYSHIIKYKYASNNLDVSTLIVDSNSLVKDAEKAYLGEFVIGRLLHAYEPLANADYLADVEKRYKKRVILEELKELVTTTSLSSELLIPADYFLYSKVQKRSKVYPHAVYSYVKTYSGENGSQNLDASRKGFMQGLKELEREGYIRFENNYVRIVPNKIKIKKGDKTSLGVSNVMRGMLSYLVHTYAGRRTLNFVKQEAMSKINRRRKIRDFPPELKNPRSLLRLEEGILIDRKDWLQELAKKLNFNDYTITRKNLGDVNAATTLYTIREDGRSERFVAKHFASVKAVKWVAANVWTAGVKTFHVDASSRLSREYRAIRYIKSVGFGVPEILAVAPNKKLLITRYIEGKRLSDLIDSILRGKSDDTDPITQFGKALGTLHAKGCTIVDSKPSNILLNNGKIYFTDLEQFTFDDNKSWDIIYFLYYSVKFTSNEEGARKVARTFLDGYMQDGNISVIKKALNKRYISPFYPVLVLGVLMAIRDEMKSFINAYS
ncbi:MAG: hypothetical protein ACE5J2_08160 [Nitrososphaerales archaeon]